MNKKIIYANMLVVDENITRCLLLTKLRGPSFLIGKDNFPGGHVDEGETPEEGAVRETCEEGNVVIPKDAPLVLVAHSVAEKSELFTYAVCVPNKNFDAFTSMTDEPLRIEEIEPYLARLAVDPECAAPDLGDLIVKGVAQLQAELTKRQKYSHSPDASA